MEEKRFAQKLTTGHDALSYINSNDRIFIHGGAATPWPLIDALIEHAPRLSNVELIHMHTEGPAPYAEPKYQGHFKVTNIFVGSNVRPYIDKDRVDYLPCFLSEVPQLFRKKIRPPRVSLIQVSPPDLHGFCSLGTSVDVTKAAIEVSELVIAEVNPQMPRVHGDGLIHMSDIDHFIETDRKIFESKLTAPSDVEQSIGKFVASLVEDGATLQVGIGAIPNAVLNELKSHRNLGLHSETWSDGALDLLESGVINNSQKKIHPWKSVSAFVIGTRRLYDFIHDNPSVLQLDVSYVNNPGIIARNNKVTAINSAVEIDLTGQVCADSVGNRIISGVGGQVDFLRGASYSKNGKPIIAVTSRSKKGAPRIVENLRLGAGVVTSRAHVHYVVTEYGIAQLFGKTLNERGQALIQIAHPEDREALDRAWHDQKKRN